MSVPSRSVPSRSVPSRSDPSRSAASLDVMVNGQNRQVNAATLETALLELGFGESKVATALNGDFVPAGRRGSTALKRGDRIEIVSARQGG